MPLISVMRVNGGARWHAVSLMRTLVRIMKRSSHPSACWTTYRVYSLKRQHIHETICGASR